MTLILYNIPLALQVTHILSTIQAVWQDIYKTNSPEGKHLWQQHPGYRQATEANQHDEQHKGHYILALRERVRLVREHRRREVGSSVHAEAEGAASRGEHRPQDQLAFPNELHYDCWEQAHGYEYCSDEDLQKQLL